MTNVDLRFAKVSEALIASITFVDTHVNAETCWPIRFGPAYEYLPVTPHEITNYYAPVKEPRKGHSCVDDEAELYMSGEQAWFAQE